MCKVIKLMVFMIELLCFSMFAKLCLAIGKDFVF